MAVAPCWLRRRHAICWWRNVPLKLHSSYLIILRTRTPWLKGSSGGLVPICPKVLIWPSQHPACIRAPEPCRDASRRLPGRHRWAFFRTFGCSMLSTCWRRPPTASRVWQLPSGTPMACRSELCCARNWAGVSVRSERRRVRSRTCSGLVPRSIRRCTEVLPRAQNFCTH